MRSRTWVERKPKRTPKKDVAYWFAAVWLMSAVTGFVYLLATNINVQSVVVALLTVAVCVLMAIITLWAFDKVIARRL